MSDYPKLDIIIPISMANDWPTEESVVNDILEQYHRYGFTKFALTLPGHVYRSVGYPPKQEYDRQAHMFLQVKKRLEPYGIVCGWWVALTMKSGRSADFQGIVKADGSEHPFANCPLDEAFRHRFSCDVADFAAVTHPAFIITEDDFSVSAAAGCYCDLHIREFNRRYGFDFTREQLVAVLSERTPEAIEIIKKWRELAKDSQVGLAAAMREELDKRTPEIPMGYLQAGLSDNDGDCTYDIARAMAGDRHVPFSRLYGATYGGIVAREIPQLLYHMLYSKQHITQEFLHYMEADTFPHNRFFSAGCQVAATMAVVFSYGFDGALFIVCQLLDGGNEETAYSKVYAQERVRFEALHQAVKHCRLKGVETCYHPLYSSLDDEQSVPWSWWAQLLGRFGIPYVTTESDVVFMEDRIARYADDDYIKRALSKTVIVDSAAAKILCQRGFGAYLGVDVGDDCKQGMLQWDLATREIIKEEYAGRLPGRHMTAPWMLAPKGNGKMLRMTVTDSSCRVLTELYDGNREFIAPAMTMYDNALGGTAVVMGLTVEKNGSQALYNYRRKHLLQTVVAACSDAYCMVKEAPDVMVVENQAADDTCDFRELLTLVNMCEDPLEQVVLRLPQTLRDTQTLQMLDVEGQWLSVAFSHTDDGVIIHHVLEYCRPMYIKIC